MPALGGVSLSVEPGELVLVVGATGSGKSTLLRTAAGLLSPTSGSVTIDGRPLDLDTAHGAVGIVFQDPESQLFADTVLDDVTFGPENLGAGKDEARQAALEALESVGLDPAEFAERSPFSLSGGEARRVAIAGVLAMEPRYLLADEPTAGLDASGRRAVRALLNAQRMRVGVIVVSHAAEEFLAHADRVVMLRGGVVCWSGPAPEVIADPAVFESCGLRPPDVLEFQLIAARRGHMRAGFSLDTSVAARAVIASGGVSS